MKIQAIMGETIEGITVRKNSVLILRSRNTLTPSQHSALGEKINKWSRAVGLRATLIPCSFDVLAVDDETGAAVLRDEQANQLRDLIAKQGDAIMALSSTIRGLNDEVARLAAARAGVVA